MNTTKQSFLEWQWVNYRNAHRDRLNLALHAATVPVFWIGTVALALAPVTHLGWAIVGVLALLFSLAAQGRGHRGEAVAPAKFRGKADFLARIFAEQWITFPRYVLTGGFARAWAEAGAERARA